MSDYVKAKVIRLPFPEKLIEELEVEDCWACEDYLKDKFGELWDVYPDGFRLECTDKNYYLDYVISYKYGADCGEYGYAFYLNDNDVENYKQLFDKGGFEYDVKDLRKVVYCYYNGCESPDYYEPEEITFENL